MNKYPGSEKMGEPFVELHLLVKTCGVLKSEARQYSTNFPFCIGKAAKSYQWEEQPCKTENEFSHDRLAMIQPRIRRSWSWVYRVILAT